MKTKNKTTVHARTSINRSSLRRGLPRVQSVWIIRGFLLITLSLACFVLASAPNAFAVIPPPDGGYPGGNTAEGQNALLSLTTGQNNTAVGLNSLSSTTTGVNNTATGSAALRFNTTGNNNTASGAGALRNNTTGSINVANGVNALQGNLTGLANTAIGVHALFSNLFGNDNTAVGTSALSKNTRGSSNTAIGVEALVDNTTGDANIGIGPLALRLNTTGDNNTAIGGGALHSNTTGFGNTAVGLSAGNSITEGNNNTALGVGAGAFQTTGSGNVYIGAGAFGIAGENNACYIASIFGQTSPSGVPVVINSNNKLGTATSSKRFKENIKSIDKASEALFSLQPVTFRYRKEIDVEGILQFGLVAEDVEKVNPDLVVRDKDGKPYTVRYDAVNAMLLNEFLKEHRKVEEQETTISQLRSTWAQQRKDFQATVAQLTRRLDEQASQIQKVSAQIEVNRQAPQMVSSHQ
jgi:Chaperone of endosialidase